MERETFEAAMRHQVSRHLKDEEASFSKAIKALENLEALNIDPRIWEVVMPMFLKYRVKEMQWRKPELLQI